LEANGLDRQLAAQTAARRGQEVALPASLLQIDSAGRHHIDHVRKIGVFRIVPVRYRLELAGASDDALSVEKAGGELFVVSRASHDHHDTLAIDTDLERFFYRKLVVPGVSRTFLDAIDLRCDVNENLLGRPSAVSHRQVATTMPPFELGDDFSSA